MRVCVCGWVRGGVGWCVRARARAVVFVLFCFEIHIMNESCFIRKVGTIIVTIIIVTINNT